MYIRSVPLSLINIRKPQYNKHTIATLLRYVIIIHIVLFLCDEMVNSLLFVAVKKSFKRMNV